MNLKSVHQHHLLGQFIVLKMVDIRFRFQVTQNQIFSKYMYYKSLERGFDADLDLQQKIGLRIHISRNILDFSGSKFEPSFQKRLLKNVYTETNWFKLHYSR